MAGCLKSTRFGMRENAGNGLSGIRKSAIVYCSNTSSHPPKNISAQLKQRVTAKRLELDLIKAKTAMKKEAANAAERIYFGNDTIEELDQCPELQAMTKSFLENLNKDDLFPNDQENAN